MSLSRFHILVITGWFTAIVAVLGIRLLAGIPTTLLEAATVLLVGCVPAVVLVAVFRGAPPQTIGEVLYDTEQASGRPSPHVSDRLN